MEKSAGTAGLLSGKFGRRPDVVTGSGFLFGSWSGFTSFYHFALLSDKLYPGDPKIILPKYLLLSFHLAWQNRVKLKFVHTPVGLLAMKRVLYYCCYVLVKHVF